MEKLKVPRTSTRRQKDTIRNVCKASPRNGVFFQQNRCGGMKGEGTGGQSAADYKLLLGKREDV